MDNQAVDNQATDNERKTRLFNILTIIVLVATVGLVSIYGLIAANVFNPFPPPTPIPVAQLPTSTPTPRTTPVPTWTPTPSPNPSTPTRTPGATPTPTTTPTFPPTVTPTDTPTPTPRATKSPWPFTYELSLSSPQYGCNWTGVAGHVQDLDGNPLIGYHVHVWGAGIDTVVTSGTDARFNTIYGSEAAWEQFMAPNPKPIEVHVQLHDPYRDDHPPVSEEIVINFPGVCGRALGYIEFTKNH